MLSPTQTDILTYFMQTSTYTHALTQNYAIEEETKHQGIAIFSGFTGRIYKNAIIKQHCQQVYFILSIYSTNWPCFKSQTTHSVILGFYLYPIGLDHFFLSMNNKMSCYVLGIHQISTTFVIHGIPVYFYITVFHCSYSIIFLDLLAKVTLL